MEHLRGRPSDQRSLTRQEVPRVAEKSRSSLLVGRDPEVFHHLPASARRGGVWSLPSKGRQFIEVTWPKISPSIWGRDPEHGPENKRPLFYVLNI